MLLNFGGITRYNGVMDIQQKLKNLPELPGVYRFLSSDGRIIYVGKSKCLRQRVRSYFTGTKEGKVARLVRQISDLEYEVCDTHLEARLLECQRIKELRPLYNSQFKRERGFVYLKIGETVKEAPLSVVHRPDQGVGPFRNRRLLESVIESFEKLYPMRFRETPAARPSDANRSGIDFTYFILPQRIATETYLQHRAVIGRLFQEESLWRDFLQDLEQTMLEEADREKYQAAIFFRDFKESLSLLRRMWFEDHKLFEELLFLRIPIPQGYKYFRIQNGLIEAFGQGETSDGSDFQRFLASPPTEEEPPWAKFSRFEQYDFRDILYSEIRSLPEEQVVRL